MKRVLSSMIFRGGVAALIALVTLASAAFAQTITTFDPPDSTYTIVSAINPEGQITGYFADGSGSHHGFLRKRNGSFIKFDAFVGTSGGFPSNAFPMDINAAGQIIGFYQQETIFGSFLRQADGTIIKFQPVFPESALTTLSAIDQGPRPFCPIDGSAAVAINAFGQITGGYTPLLCHGFLRQRDGTITSFDVRSELQPNFVPDTQPQAINLFGQITGFYTDFDSSGNGVIRGFLRQPNGGIVRFDPSGSTSTTPKAINLFAQITGYYRDTNSVVHGFLRQPYGNIITFDTSGSTDTEALSINAKGEITGFYLGADGIYHGFLRKLSGAITTFDAPNSQGTFAQSINLAGQITGYYFDGSSYHGFVRSGH